MARFWGDFFKQIHLLTNFNWRQNFS